MPAEDLLENYIEDIESKLQNITQTNKVQVYAEIEEILTKKFTNRVISRCENKEKYNAKREYYFDKIFPQTQITIKNDVKIDTILDIQSQTIESIMRSKGINEESLKIINAISIRLTEQTERMESIQVKLDELGDGLERAKKEANTVIRGIVTDKVLLCLICTVVILFFIGMCISISWNIYKRVNKFVPQLNATRSIY